jgi:predicted small lipoprotein YifL
MRSLVLILVAALLAAGCGTRGGLYLPPDDDQPTQSGKKR